MAWQGDRSRREPTRRGAVADLALDRGRVAGERNEHALGDAVAGGVHPLHATHIAAFVHVGIPPNHCRRRDSVHVDTLHLVL
jgi:hypothetical protein